jgi:DNA-binding protein
MPRKSATLIPVAPLERIMLQAGAERVSRKGAEELAQVLVDRASHIAAAAVKIASHSGRKTVQARDIELAAETFSNTA